VVLASEKKTGSVLVDTSTVEKTALLTANVGVTYSGMGPDFRVLVNKGRKAGQQYWLQYKYARSSATRRNAHMRWRRKM
jgi:20S proteasome subunit alpha 2